MTPSAPARTTSAPTSLPARTTPRSPGARRAVGVALSAAACVALVAPPAGAQSLPGPGSITTGSLPTDSASGSLDPTLINPSWGLGSTGDTGSLGSLGLPGRSPDGPEVTVDVLASGLSIPWDVAQDPAGVVVTGERDSGRITVIRPDGTRSTVAADLGALKTGGESGLMSLALAQDFATSREVYTCHSHAGADADNRVTAWTAAPDWSGLTDPRPVVTGLPLEAGGRHSGCRVVPQADGSLRIGTGDAQSPTGPQSLDSMAGKTLHVTRTGQAAGDTFPGTLIDSIGHRNVQGIAVQPGTGRVYTAEHGPDVDDEVNLLTPRANYGWNPTRGGGYDQSVPMTDTARYPDAVRAVWSSGAPTLAPSGIAFVQGAGWGRWDGALAIATLKAGRLMLLRLADDGRSVTTQAAVLQGTHGRLRSVTATPDGSLLLTTSNGGGRDEVLRVRPA